MPSNLRRYQQTGDLHFITFSCYRRQPKLGTPSARFQFERSLEQTRCAYGLCVSGYVVMPEHVHLLVTEPEKASLATALQALKQSVSRTLALRHAEAFWQARYYDFNVRSEKKHIEKLRYIHRNPVVRGLVAKPEDWQWSSFRHYVTGVEGVIEIESQWTAAKRERMGIRPIVRMQPQVQFSRPSEARTGHPDPISKEQT
jgi:putative transposase